MPTVRGFVIGSLGGALILAGAALGQTTSSAADGNVRVETTLTPRAGVGPQGAIRVTRGPVPARVAPPFTVAPGSQVQVSTTGGGGTVVIVTPPPPVVDRVVVRRAGPDLPRYTFTLNQTPPPGLPPAPTAATLTRTTTFGDTTITETRNIPLRPPAACRAPELAFTVDWGPFHYRWWSDDAMYRRGWSVSGDSWRYGSTRAGFWGP
jgi:hypothetical protein